MNPDHCSPQSRRSFLKLGGAALATAALARTRLGGLPAFAAEEHSDAYGGLKMGLQSYTLRDRTFEKMLEAMQNDLKIHYVELFTAHLFPAYRGKSKQALEKLKEHDVKALSYGVIEFTKDHDKNKEQFELAKSLSLQNLSCNPDRDAFDSLDKLTDEYNITCAIHPHGPGAKWVKIDQIHDAIKDHNKKIGLCCDTGHLIRADEDPLRALEVFKDRTYALHLKDFKKLGKDKWEDVPAGDATLDVDGVVKFLIANKSEAPVFIEYEGGNPVVSSLKSLDRVKQAVRKAKA
jgi:sugar phosphate isomerase/epimerase